MAISKDCKWKIVTFIPQSRQNVFNTEEDYNVQNLMWDSHNHLTKAIRFDSGINNRSPLGNVLLYVRENCGHFFFSGFKYIICLPDSSQNKSLCCLETADLVYYTFEAFCNEVLYVANLIVLKFKRETNLFDFSQTTCVFKAQELILEVCPT